MPKTPTLVSLPTLKAPPLVRAANTPPVVVTVAMQKGGTGKTTTAVNLAYSLSQFMVRDEGDDHEEAPARPAGVLLIDLDPQGNAARGMGLPPAPDGDSAKSLYHALHPDRHRRVALNDIIHGTPYGVDVAYGPYRGMAELNKDLGPGGQLRLRRELESLAGYDFVVIDSPPVMNELAVAGLSAATHVVAAICPGSDEVEALAGLEEAVDNTALNNPGLKINFVLLTAYDGRTLVNKDFRRTVEDAWPEEYLGTISFTCKIKEAKAYSKPIAAYDPSCYAAEDYWHAANVIAKRGEADILTKEVVRHG